MVTNLRPRQVFRRLLALWTILIGTGAAAIFLVPKANADDMDDLTYAYARQWSPAVCATLDGFPTVAGVEGVVLGIVDDGLSGSQAGEVIGWSVRNVCPEHMPELLAFIDKYSRQQVA